MNHDEEHSQSFPEAIWLGDIGHMPKDADASVITLSAKPNDTLQWNIPLQKSEKPVIFELDLGLFLDLSLPLDDSIQRAGLNLVLREFKDKTAHLEPIGVILGRVQIEELFEISWSVFEREEFIKKHKTAPEIAALSPDGRLKLKIYALSRHLDFIRSLSDILSDSTQPLILIDCSTLSGTIEDLLLYNQELFEPVLGVLKNSHFHQSQLYWEGNYIKTEAQPHEKRIGIVLPSLDNVTVYQSLKPYLETLEHFHLYPIPEEYLTTSWEQIDWLIVSSDCCDNNTIRSLKGFIAAGGQIASLGEPITGIQNTPLSIAIQNSFIS